MSKIITVPGHGYAKELRLNIEPVQEAESRLEEAKIVNAGTYNELEYVFNEAWRNLKKMLGNVRYEITNIEKTLEERKADIILDVIPEMMKDRPKSHNNADFRNAVIAKDEEYQTGLDHLNKLKAMESHFESKAKHFEKTCQYMRKQMELIKMGIASSPVRNTGGNNA